MNGETLIELSAIRKSFLTEKVETRALDDISLRVGKGEYVALSGPSGSGKSTLLSLLGLLDTWDAGSYMLNGHDVSALGRDQRASIRNREIGFVFQAFHLISDLTVEENVALPLTYRTDLGKAERAEWVAQALARVDMSHRAQHFPAQLSGGQQQRVAVARAVAGDPAILLADEPTGNLDSKNGEAVMELLRELNRNGSTICMVTHDSRYASHADREVHLFDGKVAEPATA